MLHNPIKESISLVAEAKKRMTTRERERRKLENRKFLFGISLDFKRIQRQQKLFL
jgi:hypothetical protein